MSKKTLAGFAAILLLFALAKLSAAQPQPLKTWDGKYPIDKIEVTVVYFVAKDRQALPDWRERVDYFCRRIVKFHQREFQEQSTLTTVVHPEPLVSERTTAELQDGDGDFTFFTTLREADRRLNHATGERTAYPILLVLSDSNWRNLEDFYRLRTDEGREPRFEGQLNVGRHFPGAEAGGARATYLADRGVGWGLVSADGWRVPYSGTDCVVYHEGVGHPIGLPHPRDGNNSVMSLGQYVGWISESWLDDDQKERLGWQKPEKPAAKDDLFSTFTAWPSPRIPQPGQPVALQCRWPAEAQLAKLRVRVQTELFGPWVDVGPASPSAPQPAPAEIPLTTFDRPTPVSYRIDAELADGQTVELWGYFQVRAAPDQTPLPR